jgi:hypothetical protein
MSELPHTSLEGPSLEDQMTDFLRVHSEQEDQGPETQLPILPRQAGQKDLSQDFPTLPTQDQLAKDQSPGYLITVMDPSLLATISTANQTTRDMPLQPSSPPGIVPATQSSTGGEPLQQPSPPGTVPATQSSTGGQPLQQSLQPGTGPATQAREDLGMPHFPTRRVHLNLASKGAIQRGRQRAPTKKPAQKRPRYPISSKETPRDSLQKRQKRRWRPGSKYMIYYFSYYIDVFINYYE